MGYAALDEQTGQNLLATLAALRAEAGAYAEAARALAPGTEAASAAARVLAATADWCGVTGRELRRRLLIVSQTGFTDARAERHQGMSDGRTLAAAVARYRAGKLPVLTVAIPSTSPDYAAAAVTAIPPAALGWLAATASASGLFALLGLAERGGTLPAHYLAELRALPSPELGALLATATFTTGFLVTVVTTLLSRPLTPSTVRTVADALRVAATDPRAARTLLTNPLTAAQALRCAASWPGQERHSQMEADQAVAALIKAGLAPESGSPTRVSAAWRTVATVVERDPDLVAPHGLGGRDVNRALVEAFSPFLPAVAWQGRAGPSGPMPHPAFVPGLGFRTVARFLGRLLADKGAVDALQAAVLRFARSLDLAGHLRVLPGTGEVVVPPDVVRAGWLLSGAFGLLGYAAQNAQLRWADQVELQGAILGEVLGVVFDPLKKLIGGALVVDLVVVPKLVDAFTKHQADGGPAGGREVLSRTADALVGAVQVHGVPPELRATTVAAIRAIVLATVLGPVLRVTDPNYQP